MKVYVIMSNDYPDRVFDNKEQADAFCKERMNDPKNCYPNSTSFHIYWRSYEFELIKKESTGA